MAAQDTYERFVDQMAAHLVTFGVGTEPDPALAEAAMEAVRRAVNARITAADKHDYQRFVVEVARQLVRLGVGAERDPELAVAAIEAVRQTVNERIDDYLRPTDESDPVTDPLRAER